VLDATGWFVTFAAPETSAVGPVVGSLLGVAGIGVAAADSKKGSGNALAAGTLAYTGKEVAIFEAVLQGQKHRWLIVSNCCVNCVDRARHWKNIYAIQYL